MGKTVMVVLHQIKKQLAGIPFTTKDKGILL